MGRSAFKACCAAAIAALAPVAALAGGTASGQIAVIDVRSNGYFLISFASQPAGSPACATDANKRLSGDANTAGGKAILAVATAAMASGKSVSVEGTGTCPQWSFIESISLLKEAP